MPHKVNPIDFENGEGNLFIAQNYFQFLSRKLPISRLQRDLTDSTITRNIGVPIGHMLIGIKSILKGLNKLLVNTSKISEDLSENSVVIAEAIQSQLRYLGIKDSYEKIKDVTRNNNNSIDLCEVEILIRKENLSKQYKDKIMNLSPFNYLGKVTEL
jgi:adenylosuccinate lyase